ncbi:hypothetical protein G6F57_003956 [Rhizopus arrhizus]|uniref:Major facilitator superfamily (MFS) profile domain-containing protein n=1 Tax=Rhizopus oryzae TaxID=64495 RepID=A0A9P6WX06_RHIOR|nr:hypothetical protein G6F23_012138 [Rhizopus arrhizus]KAG0779231.1 hypothetical protein G6F21_012670 [Rhizopus arrhizus]KAG0804420.1 hypothetical protein G6F20_012713 [Rhizopus arrhizus]KAG0831896.1 hypothetical protein G6F19_006507 [Rhizopus arrhizus]KAG0833881.1 hypothetical protein G6F18_006577 [Rhizopus arrhizus]
METTNSTNTSMSDSTIDPSVPTSVPISEKTEIANESVKTSTTEDPKDKRTNAIATLIALQVAIFLSALDSTIISTALPTIGSDFNQMTIVSWVATAYILTYDAFQPLFSKFSDIFGRKWILMFGIGLFLFGSVLCGAATTMIMLIIARAIAGIGAAGINSMVYIIITDIVPLEKRGSYQGVLNAVYSLSSIFGPLIGVSIIMSLLLK